jgi:hypothetical protein
MSNCHRVCIYMSGKGVGVDLVFFEVKFLNLPNPSGRTRPWGLLSL